MKDMEVKIALLKTLLLRDKSILIIIVNVVGLQKKKVPKYPMIKNLVIVAIDFPALYCSSHQALTSSLEISAFVKLKAIHKN